MTLYERLNHLGTGLTKADRRQCASTARYLRKAHERLTDKVNAPLHDIALDEDDLLELADQLDTLAAPIGVEAPKERQG